MTFWQFLDNHAQGLGMLVAMGIYFWALSR
jgi:hypothetical protein